MATAPGLAPGPWSRAVVRSIERTAKHFVILRLEVDGHVAHLPGQHYEVRPRVEALQSAQRSFSIASAPADPLVELCVQRLPHGEVSIYLADAVQVGDEIDVRGPIGARFVWDGTTPALAVGGGTGVVPLVSILRHAHSIGRPDLVCLVAAARTALELPYAQEILADCHVLALSREAGRDGRPPGHLTEADLAPLIRQGQTAFVCGSTVFAESARLLLLEAGMPSAAIRVEHFGPTG